MKKIFNLIFMIVLSMTIISCDREKLSYGEEEGGGTGTTPQMVDINLRALINMQVSEGKPSSSTRAGIATDEFIVILYKQDNSLVNSWTFKDMPELVSVLQGKYYIKVISHPQQPVDTKPYYEGASTIFSVAPGAITEVEPISCQMKSIKIMLTFGEDLIDYLGKDVTITVKVGDATYTYTDIENIKAVYFAPTAGESNLVYVTFSGTIDGYKEDFTRSYTTEAGSSLNVKFTLKNVGEGEVSSSGNANIKLTIDLKVTIINQESNITVEEEIIPEDPEEGGGDQDETKPTIKGRGFNIKEAQYVPEGDGGMTCVVDITAPKRMAHLYVTIDSETLTEKVLNDVGLKKSFDLAYPGDLEGALGKNENGEGLGFPVGNQVIGQKSLIFDITNFTPLLNIYGAANHKFIIKVVDQDGIEIEETLKLITQ